MKSSLLMLMMLLLCTDLFAQSVEPFVPVEPVAASILYRDSEEWIKSRYRWYKEMREEPDGRIPEGMRERAWHQDQSMQVRIPAPCNEK